MQFDHMFPGMNYDNQGYHIKILFSYKQVLYNQILDFSQLNNSLPMVYDSKWAMIIIF